MSDSAPARVFLAVVDETPEHRIAVRYAARRAAHTGGRLAVLYVIEPTALQHFLAIQEPAPPARRQADETPEHRIAVRYAARRAAHTGGRLAMLYVIEPTELQHFMAIEELARAERREAAEALLQGLCEDIAPIAGAMPIVFIREGRPRDELMALINEEPTISVLVLAAG